MRRTAVLLALALVCVACKSPALSTQEVRLTVVDELTHRPVQGASASYSVSVWEGTFTGHGGGNAELFSISATSDAAGLLVFPPTPIADPSPFGGKTNYGEAYVRIAHPGYKPKSVFVGHIIEPNVRAALKWGWGPDLVVKLQPK